ncbi:MAG: PD40 domain-containing protein [Bacteroidales bacterium]|nr:PD40 domain-containing protein [Bacteroidales bacterium]
MRNIIIFIILLTISGCASEITNFTHKDAKPDIFPDYTDIVIPVNIAPLNFKALNGTLEMVEVSTKQGVIKEYCNNGKLLWNQSEWKNLLKNNIGDTLKFTVYITDSLGVCYQYQPFFQAVSPDSIDSYIAYRNIETGYVFWMEMGLYQRSTETFDCEPIIENSAIDKACINCHSFCKQSPDKMLFHSRKFNPGTTILWNGKLQKYNTKTDSIISGGVYSSWNPNGYIIAMSVNKIGQRFHNDLNKRIYVSDSESDVVIMNMNTETVSTCKDLTTENLENFPAWSPDGSTLYYISAPKRPEGDDTDTSLRYSLLSIKYNAENDTWGNVDTLLTDSAAGGSITYPKPSPCGRYIAYTMGERGYFMPFNQESDIWLLDLKNDTIYCPEGINSNSSESNHNWSHSGKWLVTGSKYPDRLFTKPYFAHFNPETGTFDKRFVLPQEDPDFYERYTANFNNTDFITGEVPASEIEIRDAVRGESKNVKAGGK